MIVAETCLLLAIRNTLRTAMSLPNEGCDINLDDNIPAIAGDRYVSVCGAGVSTGERHATSGGVWDLRFNVKVTVYHRMGEVARDRRRNVFIDRLTGLNTDVGLVISAIDFSYPLLAAAKTLLATTAAAGGEYPEPFREFTVDANPRPIVQDLDVAQFPGQQVADPTIALARSVVFRRARFMKERL